MLGQWLTSWKPGRASMPLRMGLGSRLVVAKCVDEHGHVGGTCATPWFTKYLDMPGDNVLVLTAFLGLCVQRKLRWADSVAASVAIMGVIFALCMEVSGLPAALAALSIGPKAVNLETLPVEKRFKQLWWRCSMLVGNPG